jgi:hypothetical protein
VLHFSAAENARTDLLLLLLLSFLPSRRGRVKTALSFAHRLLPCFRLRKRFGAVIRSSSLRLQRPTLGFQVYFCDAFRLETGIKLEAGSPSARPLSKADESLPCA